MQIEIATTILDPTFRYQIKCGDQGRLIKKNKPLTENQKLKEISKYAKNHHVDITLVNLIELPQAEIYHSTNDKPALILGVDGQVVQRIWYKNGLRHREDDKPALIEYDLQGNITAEIYYINGIVVK